MCRIVSWVICACVILSAAMAPKRRGGAREHRALTEELATGNVPDHVVVRAAPKKRSRLGDYLVTWRGLSVKGLSVKGLEICKELCLIHVEFHLELIRNS